MTMKQSNAEIAEQNVTALIGSPRGKLNFYQSIYQKNK